MNSNTLKNMGLILLFSIAAFSMFRFVVELKAKYQLQDALLKAQGEVAALSQEKQNLLQDLEKEKKLSEGLALKNASLKDYLRASTHRITRLFHDNSKARGDLEDASARLSILKAENRALVDSRRRLYLENEQFKVKFNSLFELKKAIRELKSGKRDSGISTIGNQGFLIKDGQPTSLEKVKIEVVPAPYKTSQDNSTGPAPYKTSQDNSTGPAPYKSSQDNSTGPAPYKPPLNNSTEQVQNKE